MTTIFLKSLQSTLFVDDEMGLANPLACAPIRAIFASNAFDNGETTDKIHETCRERSAPFLKPVIQESGGCVGDTGDGGGDD
jgi:hypothetical protein